MLSKKQQTIFMWTSGILIVFLLLVSVFIWPNFYMQYRLLKGVTISDVTEEERQILEQELNLPLSKEATINSISTRLRPLEPSVYVLFSVPSEQNQAFTESILSQYTVSLNNDDFEFDNEIYPVTEAYDHNSQNFTYLKKGEERDGLIPYYLCYTDYPSKIDDIFHERIRIMPKWLDFY